MANRPEVMLLKLACAEIWVSWVPINPDYRPAEMAHVLTDSGIDLVVAADDQLALADAAISAAGGGVERLVFESGTLDFPPPHPAPLSGPAGPDSESSLLYTSGTTGRRKAASSRMPTSWRSAPGTRRGAGASPSPMAGASGSIILCCSSM